MMIPIFKISDSSSLFCPTWINFIFGQPWTMSKTMTLDRAWLLCENHLLVHGKIKYLFFETHTDSVQTLQSNWVLLIFRGEGPSTNR